MKAILGLAAVTVSLTACAPDAARKEAASSAKPITGTWQLVKGTVIEKGDTLTTNYTKNKNITFVKIINDTHFAFLQHDVHKGKDSAVFVSGGGRYSLKDSTYTEHLEYCSARNWEGNDFAFTVSIKSDTLVQQGVEKVEASGINRINIEKYVKVN
ncbi:lipocalin family protein [Hymenobacter wooponensis]|uniref:Uncharacterized protein n=1 Tax=Hymenobacter wooponensis TaxID=1525360 RepID=A0A4Z0MJT1_9BACT|nr:lipocalin family protein [Hymenobacter wooponensis]TGD79548.1 hypothetical protein EU557_15095 [Hymenobacter wooponensis]